MPPSGSQVVDQCVKLIRVRLQPDQKVTAWLPTYSQPKLSSPVSLICPSFPPRFNLKLANKNSTKLMTNICRAKTHLRPIIHHILLIPCDDAPVCPACLPSLWHPHVCEADLVMKGAQIISSWLMYSSCLRSPLWALKWLGLIKARGL